MDTKVDLKKLFGSKLREYRESYQSQGKKLSQQALADLIVDDCVKNPECRKDREVDKEKKGISVDRSSISHHEQGNTVPRRHYMNHFCNVMELVKKDRDKLMKQREFAEAKIPEGLVDYINSIDVMDTGDTGAVRVSIDNSTGLDGGDNQLAPALLLACFRNDLEQVNALINADADVNVQDESGITSLHIASLQGYLEIVNSLITADADVNVQDEGGITPLHRTSYVGDVRILNALITADANVNTQDKHGMTPLYMASLQGHLEIVNSLITADADVNVQDKNGITPLHRVSLQGHLEIVNSLITADADVNVQDKNGMTPLHLACIQGSLEIVKALLNVGC